MGTLMLNLDCPSALLIACHRRPDGLVIVSHCSSPPYHAPRRCLKPSDELLFQTLLSVIHRGSGQGWGKAYNGSSPGSEHACR